MTTIDEILHYLSLPVSSKQRQRREGAFTGGKCSLGPWEIRSGFHVGEGEVRQEAEPHPGMGTPKSPTQRASPGGPDRLEKQRPLGMGLIGPQVVVRPGGA